MQSIKPVLPIFAALAWSLASQSGAMADDVKAHKVASEAHALAQEVKAAFKNDPLLEGKRITLDTVVPIGSEAHRANFALEIERILREELPDLLANDSELTLSGSYRIDDGTRENDGLRVLLLKAQIKDKHDKEIGHFEREANDSDDLFRVLGLPGSAPQNKKATLKQRNDAVVDAINKPDFDLQDSFRVSAKGKPEWSVGIKTRTALSGPGTPAVPEKVAGLAYVKIDIGQYYEIELTNNDENDALAKIDIDGLDAANTFSEDKDKSNKRIEWPGYLVPTGTNGHGSRLTALRCRSRRKRSECDSLYSFVVAELGHGAATAMKTRGSIGVINVQFREACPPSGILRRSVGETDKGPGLGEKLKVEEVHIGQNVLSNVPIRYNRPSE